MVWEPLFYLAVVLGSLFLLFWLLMLPGVKGSHPPFWG